jgi:putative transposase
MIRGCKIRLFPTQEQEEKLWAHVHAARAVWNWGLAYEMELFKNGEKHLSAYSLKKVLTQVKKTEEYAWWNNVSSHTLVNVLFDLDDAYDRFFEIKPAHFTKAKLAKAARIGKELTTYDLKGHPKFKSKKDNDFRFPVRYENTYFLENCVNIEKVGKVQYQCDNMSFISGKNAFKISNPRIKHFDDKWILSFGIEECENQVLKLTDKPMGIDLGVKELAVVAFGDEERTFGNINKTKRVRKLKRKLKHLQRNVSRKYRTNNENKVFENNYHKSKKILKVEKRIRKVHNKLSNIRNDYTHQTTRRLINLLPYKIMVEDLNVSGMMKNKHLSKAIGEQTWYEFRRQILYKSETYGIEVVLVPRRYPSSKTCSGCGEVKKDLKLKDRVYICVKCGLKIDRDYNAAINLMNYNSVA